MAATILEAAVVLIDEGARIPNIVLEILRYAGPDVNKAHLSKILRADKLMPGKVDRLLKHGALV